jgi:hypothetical protein
VLDEVDAIIGVDAQPVGRLEQTLTPVIKEPPRAVEDHVGMIGTAEHVDIVVRVDGDGRYPPPLPSIGQLAPILDQFVLTIADIGDHKGSFGVNSGME